MVLKASSKTPRQLAPPNNREVMSWKFMRFSGILLIPLVWIHVLIQDVIVGVHAINLDYVAMRWALIGWRIYDIALLAFTFAHGMNGLRAVLFDYCSDPTSSRKVNRFVLLAWFGFSAIGSVAILGGVREP